MKRVESYEQNPEWTFLESGVYKVRANFISDSLSKTTIIEDSIVVFNGESSLDFQTPYSAVKVSPVQELSLKSSWTFEAWINPTNLFGKYILEKNSVSIYTNKRSTGLKNNSLVVKFIREDNSIIRFSTEDSSLTLNKWQHIALEYDYSNEKMEVYVDGIFQELSLSDTTIFASPIIDNVEDTLFLGNNITGLRNLKGNIDEVRIWNSALSKEEIDFNRYEYLSGTENNLVAYWTVNEGNGEMILDNSSNGNNGEIIGAQYDWGIDYQTLVGVKDQSRNLSLPNSFSLKQNYPNPFNPSTTIKYTIPAVVDDGIAKQSNVLLKVYDILGREITTLVNEIQKPGEYNVQFDASQLSSGVYLYKIITGQNISTKKMMLMK